MNKLKNLTGLFVATLILNSASASLALAKDLPDEEYGNLVKIILVKNQIVNQESQISNISTEYTLASAAFELANIENGDRENHDRKVHFRIDLLQNQVAARNYTCDIVVKIQNKTDYTGSQLTNCTYNSSELTSLNY